MSGRFPPPPPGAAPANAAKPAFPPPPPRAVPKLPSMSGGSAPLAPASPDSASAGAHGASASGQWPPPAPASPSHESGSAAASGATSKRSSDADRSASAAAAASAASPVVSPTSDGDDNERESSTLHHRGGSVSHQGVLADFVSPDPVARESSDETAESNNDSNNNEAGDEPRGLSVDVNAATTPVAASSAAAAAGALPGRAPPTPSEGRRYPLPPGPPPSSAHGRATSLSVSGSSSNSNGPTTPSSPPPIPAAFLERVRAAGGGTGSLPSAGSGPSGPAAAADDASSANPQSSPASAFGRQASMPVRGPPPSTPSSRPAPRVVASKEDTATIHHYLRQALAAKDLPALTDLVARAAEKNVVGELVVQARELVQARQDEERENEVATLKRFMRQSIDARKSEPIRDCIKKVEPIAANISTGPHRRLYADFFSLLEESKATLEALEKEAAQTVSAYLRQGVTTRSREILQAALGKAATVRHNLLDSAALDAARKCLSELDDLQMLRTFLALASKNRDLTALEEAVAQASSKGLPPQDPELASAHKLLEELRKEYASSSKVKKERAAAEKEAKHAAKKAEELAAIAEKEAKNAEKDRVKQEKEKEKERHEQEKAAASAAHDKMKADKKAAAKSKDSLKGSADTSKPLLFGGPLHDAALRNAPHAVPKVCTDCMTFLRAKALDEPGLFRVAGNKDLIDGLRAAYEADYAAHDDSKSPPALTEIHDASGLFKLYFRKLPEPLIPWSEYDKFIKVGNNKGSDRVAQLHELVKQLPKENFAALDTLFRFLVEVSARSAENKMTPENLAIVFAPNLIRPKVETAQSMMTEMPSSISVIATCIAEHDKLFVAASKEEANGDGATPAAAAASN